VIGKKEKTRLKIFVATIELFSKYGIGKTTLGDIAKKVGLAKSSMYYYFPSKEDLIGSTVQWLGLQYIEETRKLLDGDLSHPDKLGAYIYFHYKWINNKFKEFNSILDEVFSMMPRIFKEFSGDFVEEVHSMLLKVVEDGVKKEVFIVKRPSEFIYMILLSLRGLEMNDYYRQKDGMEMIDEFVEVILRGIKK
jgi:AcrR family transcriptional regulator